MEKLQYFFIFCLAPILFASCVKCETCTFDIKTTELRNGLTTTSEVSFSEDRCGRARIKEATIMDGTEVEEGFGFTRTTETKVSCF